jgi:ABC-type transporter Mla subunit MlaD
VGQALTKLASFEDQLERIASYGKSLEQLGGLTDTLARLVESTQGLGALADAVQQLERAAGDLTSTVQPLQGVAQRLNRFGRKDTAAPEAIPLSSG